MAPLKYFQSIVVAMFILFFTTHAFCEMSPDEALKVGQEDSHKRATQALELINNKKYEEAIDILNLWMNSEYTEKLYGVGYKGRLYVNPLELYLKGGCEIKLKKLEEAQHTFGLCQSMFPKNYLCSLGLGNIFHEKGNKAASAMYYRQALELVPAYDPKTKSKLEKELKEIEK